MKTSENGQRPLAAHRESHENGLRVVTRQYSLSLKRRLPERNLGGGQLAVISLSGG